MRVLMVAAARSPTLSTIREVAESFGISEAHLVKCVHHLGAWGYLDTVRGNKGGFRLAKPASDINVGEVIRRTEDGFNTVECFDPSTNTCPLSGSCRLSVALKRGTQAFLAALDELSLADITVNGDELLSALDLVIGDCETPPAA
jgi:Rrf2 family nitric oxide-sensitive transcriptional repressor